MYGISHENIGLSEWPTTGVVHLIKSGVSDSPDGVAGLFRWAKSTVTRFAFVSAVFDSHRRALHFGDPGEPRGYVCNVGRDSPSSAGATSRCARPRHLIASSSLSAMPRALETTRTGRDTARDHHFPCASLLAINKLQRKRCFDLFAVGTASNGRPYREKCFDPTFRSARAAGVMLAHEQLR